MIDDELEELYDYDELRRIDEPTMFEVSPTRTTLVLGSAQPSGVLSPDAASRWAIRRRRGGGGVVALHPDDLWVDGWIPVHDPRHYDDVRAAADIVGRWWQVALRGEGAIDPSVHVGAVIDDPRFRVACFTGAGPGEVFVGGRKVVGVTQWRVREGTFLSTVCPVQDSRDIVAALAAPPDGLDHALDHATLADLGVDPGALLARLEVESGPWRHRRLILDA